MATDDKPRCGVILCPLTKVTNNSLRQSADDNNAVTWLKDGDKRTDEINEYRLLYA